MTDAEHVDRLDQRRRWLTERIKAKQIVGWDVEYDTSERDALAWAIPHLIAGMNTTPTYVLLRDGKETTVTEAEAFAYLRTFNAEVHGTCGCRFCVKPTPECDVAGIRKA